ncbi:MAG: hypothetical protein IT381_23420 [Deltaproteobacteria bacterium]|nr:hypothetical protein [Deltaproteobacteria bacterium]
MSDLGGMGKSSQDMVKELQKMQQQDLKQDKPQEGGAKFGQALNNQQVNQTSEAQNLQKVQDASKAQQTIQAAASNKMNANVGMNTSQRVGEAGKSEKGMFKGVVKELMAGQNKMEDLMKVAMSGQKLSNQEMLGIQAGVYMFSQQMELTSKVIEKATSGIKQTLNTQL